MLKEKPCILMIKIRTSLAKGRKIKVECRLNGKPSDSLRCVAKIKTIINREMSSECHIVSGPDKGYTDFSFLIGPGQATE